MSVECNIHKHCLIIGGGRSLWNEPVTWTPWLVTTSSLAVGWYLTQGCHDRTIDFFFLSGPLMGTFHIPFHVLFHLPLLPLASWKYVVCPTIPNWFTTLYCHAIGLQTTSMLSACCKQWTDWTTGLNCRGHNIIGIYRMLAIPKRMEPHSQAEWDITDAIIRLRVSVFVLMETSVAWHIEVHYDNASQNYSTYTCIYVWNSNFWQGQSNWLQLLDLPCTWHTLS